MKVLVIDTGKCALDIAYRAQEYGHEVRYWLPDTNGGNRRCAGDGIVPRVKDWRPSMKWADLILTSDNCFYIDALQPYFNQGYPIFGCNRQAGELELDRDKGMKALESCGIETMPSKKFNSYKDAEKYVREHPKDWVCKPIGESPKEYSYVAKSAADLVYKLQQWQKNPPPAQSFILQEKIKGIEFAVGGWFGRDGWSQWITENFEHKKFLSGDYGVSTGETGTVLRYVKKSQLFDEVLKPCTDYLFDIGYVGYCDIAVMVTEDGTPYPLEWTNRFGWPLFAIQSRLHKGDPVKWMADLLEGRDTLQVSEDIACGVVMSHGDYPYSYAKPEENTGAPIYGLTKSIMKDFRLFDVCKREAPVMKGGEVVEEETWCTAGNYIAVATGLGKTVREACDNAYSVVESIEIPTNVMVRDDIGERLKKQLPDLQKHGFARGMKYD